MIRNKLVKILLVFAVITSTMLFSFNANTKNDTTDTENKKESLTFRITWKAYSGKGEAIKKIIDGYNKLNQSKYDIKLISGDEDIVAIESQLDDEGAADIYMLPYRYVQYFGYKNKLKSLTESFNSENTLFYEKLWELSVVNDKVYGIPWLGHTMGLIYNKDLLNKASVDSSKINNLESLVSACKKVEANTKAKGIGLVGADHNDVSWMVNQFIYGFGGTLVDSTGKKVTINSKEAKAAITFYKDELGKYAQATWKNDTGIEAMNAFREQKVAFEIQGLWGVTDIWKSGEIFKTGVIPLESIGLYPEVGPMMLSIPTKLAGEKEIAAINFMQYLISIKAQTQILDGEYIPERDEYYPFRLPVRRDMNETTVFKDHPEFTAFISGFSKPSVDVPVPLWQTIKDKIYAPGLHQVMEEKMSIDEFLQKVETEGNIILQGTP
jgi:multiple sugar transport system substrate-binding protein